MSVEDNLAVASEAIGVGRTASGRIRSYTIAVQSVSSIVRHALRSPAMPIASAPH